MQWWYFDAVLDNGHRLVTFFLPKVYGAIDDHEFGLPILDIVLRKPGGETIRERRFFSPTELKTVPNNFGAYFGSDCSASFTKGSGRKDLGCYHLIATAGRITYDIKLEPELPPWAPVSSSGKAPRLMMMLTRGSIFTKDYMYYVPFVPRGRLTGQITVDGEPLNARGIAYHEQGIISFPLHEVVPAWYWLHIEKPPWTILSGTTVPSLESLTPKKGTHGGFACIYKGNQCLLAVNDYTGFLVNWMRLLKRNPEAQGELSMAWEADVRLLRLGLKAKIKLVSREILEFMPIRNRPEGSRIQPYWGQTVGDAEVEIIHGIKRDRVNAEGLLETMVTGK